ncbi:MAG TPA: DUF3048 domain-containing protein [Acidimicrobiales bacterium]|nr:DUF3048 domain-containing protein [Acidimicrobiales bacterium]
MKRKTIALLVLAVLALTAACGGGGSSAADVGQAGPIGRGPNEPPGGSAPVIGNFPLTGMPAVDAAKLRRPAVTVKIDNNVQARPQAGLEAADVIYEEFTEGITRFVVVFQSADAGVVGPVRSVRPGDPHIAKPFGGPLVFSGGSAPVLGVVRAAGIPQVTENDRETLRRRSGRRAPHNLYTDTNSMFRKAGAGSAPPAFSPFLALGAAPTAAGATPVPAFRLSPAPGVTAQYQWDATEAVWKRSTDGRPHTLEGGAQLSPRNVIVQYTPYVTFPDDPKVRYPEVVGSGEAVVFTGGMQVRARWSKSSTAAMTTFTDTAGRPIALSPGQTWVHLQTPGAAPTIG